MASNTPSGAATLGPVREVKGTKIEPYYPPSTYKVRCSSSSSSVQSIDTVSMQTFGTGIDHPLSDDPDFCVEKSTLAFVKEQLKLDDNAVKVQRSFSSDIAHHAYVDQLHV
jgi:hypothetical protein